MTARCLSGCGNEDWASSGLRLERIKDNVQFENENFRLASNQAMGLLYARNECDYVQLYSLPRADGRGTDERLVFLPDITGLA
eukprot:2006872-Lingulodinium_polyedra.AAC.1